MATPLLLVVDDDADARALLADVLKENGYAVQEAADGATAIARAAQSPPRLILLDMRMPVMDGWQFAQAYRQLPGPHAPLLIMTAAQDPVAWAAEVDGVACVAKPYSIEDLLRLVRNLLEREGASASDASLSAGGDGGDPESVDHRLDTEMTSPLLGELAFLLMERQTLMTQLDTAEREPKPLVDRLDRNRRRAGALLTQLAALVPPDDAGSGAILS